MLNSSTVSPLGAVALGLVCLAMGLWALCDWRTREHGPADFRAQIWTVAGLGFAAYFFVLAASKVVRG